MRHPFTVDESSFPNAKPRQASLVAYKVVADVAAKGSLYVITIAAARRLAPHGFGVFALGSTLGWMLAVAADCGIQLHLARAVARDPDAGGALLRQWLRVRFRTALAAVLLVAVAVVVFRVRAETAAPLVALTVVYACNGVIEFLHYFYRGLSRSDIESTLTLWQRLGTLACAIGALVWQPTIGALSIAMLVPSVATLVASLAIAARLGRERAGALDAPLILSQSKDEPHATGAAFRRDVLPIGVGIVLSAAYFRVDVFLVQLWVGTESVAVYNAVFRLVEALRLLPAAVLAVALPALCRAADTRPVARISAWLAAFGIVTSVILWIAADWLIPFVYGSEYSGGVSAFRILLLSLPLLSLNYALTYQLVGWDRQHAYARLCAIALAVNLALNARLIPALSIDGAAWATLGTEAALTIGCLIALAASRPHRAAAEALAG